MYDSHKIISITVIQIITTIIIRDKLQYTKSCIVRHMARLKT